MQRLNLIIFFLTATLGFSQDLYVSNNASISIYVVGTGFAEYNATTNPNAAALFVTNDIQLAGVNSVIYLRNEAQLLQQNNVNNSGAGHIFIDQQGTSNLYNYNYWGSPVSTADGVLPTDPRSYDLSSILSNVITWTSGLDGNPTPLTISTRWLHIFDDEKFDDYDAWEQISQTTPVDIGLGYIMKGSGAATATQNYDFRGRPNNGNIQNAISGGTQGTLVGNPYPSALDSHEFIDDNVSALLDGTLLFWVQAPSNNSHYLAQYEGRYSYYNKIGGAGAATPPIEISGNGDASNLPTRYIPVGQGFFVLGDTNGGNITFENDQRLFVKESSGNSIFLAPNNEVSEAEIASETNNGITDNIKRIRLNFKSPEGAIRHLLLGFTSDNKATDGVDYGYDGLNSDDFPSDLSFVIDKDNYVIQGVGKFNLEKKYPLSMVLGEKGDVEIALDALENFNEAIDVYVYDDWLKTSTKLNDINYESSLEEGVYDDRFFITFKDSNETLGNPETNTNDFVIFQNNKASQLTIINPNNLNINSLSFHDVTGKQIFNHVDLHQKTKHVFSTEHLSEGVYLVTVKTANNNTINKKVIVTN